MRKIFISILMLVPTVAFAAGGYIGPVWLEYVFSTLLLAFPLTFLFVGYLSFWVPNTSRFMWLYVLDLCVATFAVVSAIYLMTNENIDWLGNLCLLSVLFVPIYTAYISYGIDKATMGKHSKQLKYAWYAVLTSVVVVFASPIVLIFLQLAIPSLQFYL